jgi:alcohol dehydrogenase
MNRIRPFAVAALPQLQVGVDALEALPLWLAASHHLEVILCIGGSSFARAGHLDTLLEQCERLHITPVVEHVTGEPTPEIIDGITKRHVQGPCTCVAGIGGGSVIDSAKAVSAMIAESRAAGSPVSVVDHLEGVGTRTPSGSRIGLAAVPTTSGTGSEATKNAVISRLGAQGFKKSLRHERYVPDLAILDGSLITSCPAAVTAASGLDAVTQLLEAYVSTASSAFTDMIAIQGLSLAAGVLESLVCGTLSDDPEARTVMAYAAYLSGVALANANLGVVHGAASALGGRRPIAHGVVCGTLLHAAQKAIIHHLALDESREAEAALYKYSQAGYALAGLPVERASDHPAGGLKLLLDTLERWQELFSIPRLHEFGFTEEELASLALETGVKNTPAALSTQEIAGILIERL